MLNRLAGFATALLLLVLASTSPAIAEVTRLEIAAKQPFGSFLAGDYVIW